MEPSPNRLQRRLAQLERLGPLAAILRQGLLRRAIPFTGTAGLVFRELTPDRVVIALPNRRRVQNHIRGVHAAATALLAETASGLALGMHLPDDRLPLLKSMDVRYVRRANGGLLASATLTGTDIERIHREEKGEVTIRVDVRDEDDEQPVECTMTWAWVLRQK